MNQWHRIWLDYKNNCFVYCIHTVPYFQVQILIIKLDKKKLHNHFEHSVYAIKIINLAWTCQWMAHSAVYNSTNVWNGILIVKGNLCKWISIANLLKSFVHWDFFSSMCIVTCWPDKPFAFSAISFVEASNIFFSSSNYIINFLENQ